jgi:hypothetical protein
MRKAILGVVLLMMLAGTAQATPIFFTDKNLWDQAVAARTSKSATETFDDQILEPWLTILSDEPGQIAAFQWESIVDSAPVKNDTFFHSWPGVFAWGAAFNLLDPGGPGEGINVFADLAGMNTLVATMPGTYNDFWGFVLDNNDYFTHVRLGGGGGAGVQETYWMDNLSIGADVVPDPGSTLFLLGMGLAGLTAWRKRLQ